MCAERAGDGAGLKRRGILAAAGAVVAGIAAKAAAQPVAADGTFVAPGANTASGATTLQYTGSGGLTTANVLTVADGTDFSSTSPAAVAGYAEGGKVRYGVFGFSSSSAGVIGKGAGTSTGVYGSSDSGTGVIGSSGGSNGAFIFTTAAAGSGMAGVYGQSSGSGTYALYGSGLSGIGVAGVASGTNAGAVLGTGTNGAYGVQGTSNGIGVYGTSTGSYGILGVSSAGGAYSGVTGSVFTGSGAAFAGGAQNASAYAAYFTGKVNIDGPFLVNGTQRFTLKHADGTSRLVAGTLSVEPVVEDFGKGTLANGAATVTLDADFREVADTSDYHVFLTMYDTVQALCVANRTATGFVVRAQDASASGTFSYRIVAKPKDTGGKVARLAKYEQPNIKIPGINGEPLPPAVNAPVPPTPERWKDMASPAPNPLPQPRATTAPAALPAPPAPQSAATAPPAARSSGAPPVPSVPNPAPPPRP